MWYKDSLDASKIFNEYAEYYLSREDKNPNRKHLTKVLKGIMSDVGGKKILDVGCGGGQNVFWLSLKGAIVDGVDISERMIEIARINCIDTDANFFVSDMAETSFPDNHYDIILSSFSAMYKKDLKKILAEFRRLLKTNGELIIVVSHPIRKMLKHTRDYFKSGKHWENLGRMKIFNYHRTVEDYVAGLAENNFIIKEFRELKNRDDKAAKFVFPEYLLIRAILH